MNSSLEKSRLIMHRYVFSFLIVLAFGTGVLLGNRVPQEADATEIVESSEEATALGEVVNKNAPERTLPSSVDFQQFWDVWQKIQEKSVKRPVDDVQLYYGAVSGLVAGLNDPYSVFFTPDIAKQFQEQLQGSFSGIGAEVGIKDGQVVIVAPLPETPAERAGLQPGDAVLLINGESTAGISVDEAVKRIRGAKGTKVKLMIGREGAPAPIEISITRDTIEIKSVVAEELENGIVRITVSSFDEQTHKLFNEAVRFTKSKNPKGIILDLRNDPGGYFESAIEVASEFLGDNQVVVAERGAGAKTREEFFTAGEHRLRGIPLVVLINEGSASASEIVAGALQDHKAATVVGTKSFGKGSVQEYEQLSDGSALKLTVALWYTPLDRSINSEGIKPDIAIEPKKPDTQTQVKPGEIDENLILSRKDWKKDPYIIKALQVLKQK